MGAQREPSSPINVMRSSERGLERVMSQIAVVWRLVGPLLLGHPLVIVLRAWFLAMVRLLLAFVVAVAAYGLAMLVVVEVYPPDRPMAALLYGVALAVATWFGTCAGALAARQSQQRLMANGAAGLALAMAVGLAVEDGLTGPGQGYYLFYVFDSGVGGLAAIRLLSSLPLRHTAAA
jgi:hypothetical protein